MGPRTEAGRALLAIDHEPKGPCFDSPDCDCGRAIAAIEAEALADSLDAAWAEAEAALPKGWIGPDLSPIPDTPGEWSASAFSRAHWEGEKDEYHDERGPTPASVLRALAAKLRDA